MIHVTKKCVDDMCVEVELECRVIGSNDTDSIKEAAAVAAIKAAWNRNVRKNPPLKDSDTTTTYSRTSSNTSGTTKSSSSSGSEDSVLEHVRKLGMGNITHPNSFFELQQALAIRTDYSCSCGETNSLVEEEDEIPHRFDSELVAVENIAYERPVVIRVVSTGLSDIPKTTTRKQTRRGNLQKALSIAAEKSRTCSKQLFKTTRRKLLQQKGQPKTSTDKKRISPRSRPTVKEILGILSSFLCIQDNSVVNDAYNGNRFSSAKDCYTQGHGTLCWSSEKSKGVSSTTKQISKKCNKGTNDHQLSRSMAQQIPRLRKQIRDILPKNHPDGVNEKGLEVHV